MRCVKNTTILTAPQLTDSIRQRCQKTKRVAKNKSLQLFFVKRRRLELPRNNFHYPLKVARLPIPPPLQHVLKISEVVPRTGLEPARRETHAPETCASTNSATWANALFKMWSGKRDSDPRPQPWQGCALPTELFPPLSFIT